MSKSCGCTIPCADCARRQIGKYPEPNSKKQLVEHILSLNEKGMLDPAIVVCWKKYQKDGIDPRAACKAYARAKKLENILCWSGLSALLIWVTGFGILFGLSRNFVDSLDRGTAMMIACCWIAVPLAIIGGLGYAVDKFQEKKYAMEDHLFSFAVWLWRVEAYTGMTMTVLRDAKHDNELVKAATRAVERTVEEVKKKEEILFAVRSKKPKDHTEPAQEVEDTRAHAEEVYRLFNGFPLPAWHTFWQNQEQKA